MEPSSDYGVHSVVRSLRGELQAYIEAQYHIRNVSLIEERRRLLSQEGNIYQLPHVEATPSYKSGKPYANLDIPDAAKDMLTRLSSLSPSVGVYGRPYEHQAEALEHFLSGGNDLIVATGTGSGKTECFLLPIIGMLAQEGIDRPSSAAKPGFRALLLYPMNALVNDQLSRLRRLFGDLLQQ